MNFESQLENSLSDRFVDIPLNEADNEFMEINIEFSFNPRFTQEIPIVYDEPILKNTLIAIKAALNAISKNTSKEFYFIRPQLIFKPYPKISILGKVKLRKKEEEMDEKIKKLQKDTKKVVKEEASLLKADKKHDKLIEKAKKKIKKK